MLKERFKSGDIIMSPRMYIEGAEMDSVGEALQILDIRGYDNFLRVFAPGAFSDQIIYLVDPNDITDHVRISVDGLRLDRIPISKQNQTTAPVRRIVPEA